MASRKKFFSGPAYSSSSDSSSSSFSDDDRKRGERLASRYSKKSPAAAPRNPNDSNAFTRKRSPITKLENDKSVNNGNVKNNNANNVGFTRSVGTEVHSLLSLLRDPSIAQQGLTDSSSSDEDAHPHHNNNSSNFNNNYIQTNNNIAALTAQLNAIATRSSPKRDSPLRSPQITRLQQQELQLSPQRNSNNSSTNNSSLLNRSSSSPAMAASPQFSLPSAVTAAAAAAPHNPFLGAIGRPKSAPALRVLVRSDSTRSVEAMRSPGSPSLNRGEVTPVESPTVTASRVALAQRIAARNASSLLSDSPPPMMTVPIMGRRADSFYNAPNGNFLQIPVASSPSGSTSRKMSESPPSSPELTASMVQKYVMGVVGNSLRVDSSDDDSDDEHIKSILFGGKQSMDTKQLLQQRSSERLFDSNMAAFYQGSVGQDDRTQSSMSTGWGLWWEPGGTAGVHSPSKATDFVKPYKTVPTYAAVPIPSSRRDNMYSSYDQSETNNDISQNSSSNNLNNISNNNTHHSNSQHQGYNSSTLDSTAMGSSALPVYRPTGSYNIDSQSRKMSRTIVQSGEKPPVSECFDKDSIYNPVKMDLQRMPVPGTGTTPSNCFYRGKYKPVKDETVLGPRFDHYSTYHPISLVDQEPTAEERVKARLKHQRKKHSLISKNSGARKTLMDNVIHPTELLLPDGKADWGSVGAYFATNAQESVPHKPSHGGYTAKRPPR